MLKYFRNSMLRVTVEFNPFNWYLWRDNAVWPNEHEPNLHAFTFQTLFLTVLIMIDDGTFIAKPGELYE